MLNQAEKAPGHGLGGTVLGGTLLIVGTSIGGAMLGLPVKTAAIGFYPTLGLFAVVWAVMAFTAFLMLEASFSLKGQTNLISMAKFSLGPAGASVAWLTYLFFLYSLISAYASGGTGLLSEILALWQPGLLPHSGIMWIFVGLFALVVFLGPRWVDITNRWLVLGLVVSYLFLLWAAGQTHSIPIKSEFHGQFIWFSIPLVVTSFGFHLLIPSLKTYLNEDVQKLRWAIGIGSFIPLVAYGVWQFVIVTTLPTWGSHGLVAILNGQGNPAELLVHRLSHYNSTISLIVMFFSFFALVSSFIGVALGLFDFFADGLEIPKTVRGRLLLTALTFVPPVLFTMLIPNGFLRALGYAGIFAAVLLIIYPAMIVLAVRSTPPLPNAVSVVQEHPRYRVAVGRWPIICTVGVGGLVIVLEIASQLRLLPLPSIFMRF